MQPGGMVVVVLVTAVLVGVLAGALGGALGYTYARSGGVGTVLGAARRCLRLRPRNRSQAVSPRWSSVSCPVW